MMMLLSFEEIVRESCTKRGDSSVEEAWGRWIWQGTSYISGIMWIDGANPIATPTIEINCMEQVCVCLSCILTDTYI